MINYGSIRPRPTGVNLYNAAAPEEQATEVPQYTLERPVVSYADEKIIKLAKDFSLQEITAARIEKTLNMPVAHRDTLARILAMEPAFRTQFLTHITGLAGKVPAGPVGRWPDAYSLEELHKASLNQTVHAVYPVTRYNLASVLMSLQPGKSGRTTHMSMQGSVVTWTYAMSSTETTDVKFSYDLAGGALSDLAGANDFIKQLVDDGHRLKYCISDVFTDFVIAFFFAIYAVTYDGSARKIRCRARSYADTFRMSFAGKPIAILDPSTNFAYEVFTALIAHLHLLDVPANPPDMMAFVWENRNFGPEKSAGVKAILDTLSKAYKEQYASKAQMLEMDFIELSMLVSTPVAKRDPRMQFSPTGFHQAITKLELFRAYRAADTDPLNVHAKTVGLTPIGLGTKALESISRHKSVADYILLCGFKKCTIYTDERSLDVVPYLKEKGVAVTVYTSAANVPNIVTRSFIDAHDNHANDEFVIVDVHPNGSSSLSGFNTTANRWNAYHKIYQIFSAKRIPHGCIYAHPLVNKDGHYLMNSKGMADFMKEYTKLGINFAGVRPHNGEYILHFTKNAVPVEGKTFEWNDLGRAQNWNVMFELLGAALAHRIDAANEIRTFAYASGQWSNLPMVKEIVGSDYETVLQYVSGAISEVVGIRTSHNVKVARDEISVRSTATGYEEQKPVEGADTFLADRKGKNVSFGGAVWQKTGNVIPTKGDTLAEPTFPQNNTVDRDLAQKTATADIEAIARDSPLGKM